MKRQTMYIRMVTASVARRKSRMLVALLAITVGATILAGMVTVYYDLPRQMGMQFRNYGANMILVPGGDSNGIAPDEMEKALAVIPADDVVGKTPYSYESATINSSPVLVAGADLEAAKATSPFWYVNGEWPAAPHEVLVGLKVADTFGLEPGDKVKITYLPPEEVEAGENITGGTEGQIDIEFTVSGLLDTGGNEEGYFFITSEDMAELTNKPITYDVIELSLQASSEELDAYSQAIEDLGLDITPQLVKRVTESETTVLSKLQALVLLVTIITLALTMICVATTMTAVVTERRREIGLRKALGASDKSIMLEFMGEGLVLGFVGGILGSILGFVFAQIVSTNVFNSTITFLPALVPITIAVALAVTAIACVLPVRNATKVDPALVLKGE